MNDQPPRVIPENKQPQQSPMKMLKTSLEEEIDKEKKIGKIIEKLEAQQKKVKEKAKNRETSFYRILGKYITFLEYIRSIIEVKIGKDQKIIALQENVFNSINVITNRIQNNINLSLPQEEKEIKKIQENTKQNNDYPNTTIEQLDKEIQELTDQLEDLRKKQNKEKVYLLDFNTSINGLNLNNKKIIEQKEKEIKEIQEACTKSIKNNVNTFITTLSSAKTGGSNNNAKLNTPSFQGNAQGYYDIIINNIFETPNAKYGLTNNNITENQRIHTNKLIEIKEAYEEQLGINVKNYKKICDALKTLLEKIGETNNKLKIFNKSKEKINEKNKLMEEINTANKGIDETNKDIEIANKIIENKREKKAQVEKLQEQKTQLETLIKNNKIIYKILNLQDIKNDKIFQANHEALVGNNDESGLYGEIKNAQKRLTNAEIKVKGVIVNNATPGTDQTKPTAAATNQTKPQRNNSRPSLPPQSPRQNISKDQAQRRSSSSNSVASINSEISVEMQQFLEGIKDVKLNNEEKNTIDIKQEIDEKLNELKNLKGVNVENRNQEAITQLENKIRELFEKANFGIAEIVKDDLNGVPGTALTEQQTNLISKYIRLLTYNGNLEAGLEVIKKDPKARDLLEQIFKETNDNRRHSLLLKLYENRPERKRGGGKYKMKKSKKSKSKTTKTTSKKAKSTKKPKTTRTQTKSYNNPKYKNQDGGFVRGGVLFPESFYRSDIVM